MFPVQRMSSNYHFISHLSQVFLPQDCYIFVKLHVQRIRMLKLEINAHTVMKSIIKNSKVKLTSSDVRINNATSLAVSYSFVPGLIDN